MIRRCTDSNHAMFYCYGGDGITVHADWLGPGGFERFLVHVGERPTKKHTLARTDPTKGYEPGNVKWKTRNHVDGREHHVRTAIGPDGLEHSLSLAAWAKKLKIDYRSLCKRMQRHPGDVSIFLRGRR